MHVSTYFADPAAANTVVEFDTALGKFDVELYDKTAPRTVANFLNYVADKDYAGTFVHRSVKGFVAQGGGFKWPGASSIPLDAPVANEFGASNARGTIAMARQSGQPNSATSQWYVNLADNADPLDTTDGGYTVFGQVLGNGMTVVDAIAALPTYDFGSPFGEVPLIGYTSDDYAKGVQVEAKHIVLVQSVTILSGGPTLTFQATSNKPTLVAPTVSGTTLTLTYGAGLLGSATVTVRATHGGGKFVEQSFKVTVAGPPLAKADTATTATNAAIAVNVLANDTAQGSPIDPATVTVVTAPQKGSTVVDPITGSVTYTPLKDYAGADSFTYTVKGTDGQVSGAATVSVQIVAPPLTPVITQKLPDLNVEQGAANTVIKLASYFGPSSQVRFDTIVGKFDVELYDAQAPNTVVNFLKYVTDKDYNSTIVHRTVANFCVQGGGFKFPSIDSVATDAAIKNEFGVSNTRGTIAMARESGKPDSATSQWYINLANNSDPLDKTDGGYAVFGHVLGDGMTVVDAIGALPRYAFSSPFGEIPLINYTTFPDPPPKDANFVVVNSVSVLYSLTFTATSNDPSLVTPTVSGKTLTLAYGAASYGTATVTVRATDTQGVFVEQSFKVSVTGPPLANDDAAQTNRNTPVAVSVLANDDDQGQLINPATVAITAAAKNGSAVADPATGSVTYTPAKDYVGFDFFSYTVKDIAGRTSQAALVTVEVIGQAVKIGAGTSIRYTDPDGTVVTITLTGAGTATAFFTGSPKVTQSGSTIIVTGSGIKVYRLDLSKTGTSSVLTFTTSGGTVAGAAVGAITGSTPVGKIQGSAIDLDGPGIVMTGKGYVATVVLRDALNGARIAMPGTGATVGITLTFRNIPNPNTEIDLGSHLTSLTCAQWVGGGLWAPSAATIAIKGDAGLKLPGNLGADITLDGVSPGLAYLSTVTVAGRITGGTWDIDGTVGTVSAASSSAGWTLKARASVKSLSATTNLGGKISAASIGSVTVGRILTASLTATDPHATRVSLGSLSAARVNAALVNVRGGINTITVSEWMGGRIDAAWVASLVTTPNTSQKLTGEINGLTLVLSGATGRSQTLASATLAGKLGQSTWLIAGNVGPVKANMVDQLECTILGNLSLFSFVAVSATDLAVDGAIGALQGTQWDAGSVWAHSLGSLKIVGNQAAQIHGNFTAAMTLTGGGVAQGQLTLGSASVSYAVAYAQWDITGPVGPISAYIVEDWSLKVHGAAPSISLTYVTRGEVTVDGTLSSASSLQWAGGKIQAARLASANLGLVSDLNVTATGAIGTLQAITWQRGAIAAKTLSLLNITGSYVGGFTPGDFLADITLAGSSSVTEPLGTVKIARRVLGGSWHVTGNVGSVDVFSWFQKCHLHATGNIRSMAVGALDSSVVYAGVANAVVGLPITAADFSSAASIQKLVVRGIPVSITPVSVSDSIIAARTLVSVTLTNVQTDNAAHSHNHFGVAARTLNSLTWKQGSSAYAWPSPWPSKTGDFVVQFVP